MASSIAPSPPPGPALPSRAGDPGAASGAWCPDHLAPQRYLPRSGCDSSPLAAAAAATATSLYHCLPHSRTGPPPPAPPAACSLLLLPPSLSPPPPPFAGAYAQCIKELVVLPGTTERGLHRLLELQFPASHDQRRRTRPLPSPGEWRGDWEQRVEQKGMHRILGSVGYAGLIKGKKGLEFPVTILSHSAASFSPRGPPHFRPGREVVAGRCSSPNNSSRIQSSPSLGCLSTGSHSLAK